MKNVLIAHKSPELIRFIENAVLMKGGSTVVRQDWPQAADVVAKQEPDAVVVQIDLAGSDWIELINYIKARRPNCRIVVLSEETTARLAARALRAGAFDFLTEPLDAQELNDCLDRLLDEDEENPRSDPVDRDNRYHFIIGDSPAIKKVFRLVDKVAKTDSTVMIYGESGTGKELLAKAIHLNSKRFDKPLIPVNCGAIPEELLESELFGHEKGAFTSAIRTRIGRFEMSNTGTIFLDEIADMSPKLQVKILRVLQEHNFERIGGTKTIDVDIRVITATNKNLRQAMETGQFREDLFYRLNVIPMAVPPLRERRTDIPVLVEHFLKRFRDTRGSLVQGIDEAAMAKLVHYHWPGNIRELENIIERMVILAENETLAVADLPPRIANAEQPPPATPEVEISEDGIDFNQMVSDFENRLLLQALEKADWVKNKAAQLLKLNRTTLVEKLKKKNIQPPIL